MGAASSGNAGRFARPYADGSLPRELDRAGNLNQRRGSHAAALETAMRCFLDIACTDVITQTDRLELIRLLSAARRAAHTLLPLGFPREKIDIGFQGAIGLAAVWAMPFDERIGAISDSAAAWQLWLRMFFADVENVNRANRLATMPHPVVLFDLNERDDGQAKNVASFPPRFS